MNNDVGGKGIVCVLTRIHRYNATIYITRGGGNPPPPGSDPTDPTTTTCTLNLNGPLFGIVMILNLLLVLAMATVLARSTFAPLATVGDALRSFLRRPDPATEGACMLTKRDVRHGRGWGVLGHTPGTGAADGDGARVDTGNSSRNREPLGTPFVPRTHLWLHFPSLARWGFATLAWLAACAPAAVGLALLLARPGPIGGDDGEVGVPLWTTTTTIAPPSLFPPLGTPHTAFASPAQPPAADADRGHVDDAAVQTALLAALPQLPVAVLYLAANALLTTYFLGQEYASYAAIGGASSPRPLRVSSAPAGQQTTGLYLTLPRPVSWLLLVLFAGLGFLASQAVSSLVVMDPILDSDSDPAAPLVALTLNTTALLALCTALAALAAFTLVLGFRQPPPAPLLGAPENEKRGSGKAGGPPRANPLAQALRGGSCSAVFSAACHPYAAPYPPSRAAAQHRHQPSLRPSPRRLSGRLPTPMSPFGGLLPFGTAQSQPLSQQPQSQPQTQPQPTTPLSPSPSSPSLLLSPTAQRLAPLEEEEGGGGTVEDGPQTYDHNDHGHGHESARGVVAWGVMEDPALYQQQRRGTMTTAGISSFSANDSYQFNDGGPAGGGGMRVGRCAFSGAVVLEPAPGFGFGDPDAAWDEEMGGAAGGVGGGVGTAAGPPFVLTSALGPVDLARRYA